MAQTESSSAKQQKWNGVKGSANLLHVIFDTVHRKALGINDVSEQVTASFNIFQIHA